MATFPTSSLPAMRSKRACEPRSARCFEHLRSRSLWRSCRCVPWVGAIDARAAGFIGIARAVDAVTLAANAYLP